jgi:hypothetical protein
MTRKSDTVEYFPHFANASTKMTLLYLEGKYQYKGYALWFKLLECLASTEGHYLNLKLPLHQGFLTERLRITYSELTDILQELSSINAIDKELWTKNQIIWSDNFIANLSTVYTNRHRELPIKPILGSNGSKPLTNNLQATYSEGTVISRVEEVEKSRVEEVEDTTTKNNNIEKVKITFFTFKSEERYKTLDFDNEFKKFCEYWFEGKRKLKNKVLACHNWLDHALSYQGKEIAHGKVNSNPDKFIQGKYGHMVKS